MKTRGKIISISNWILRSILAIVFLLAAYGKIQAPYPFWEFIERLLFIPASWAKPVLWGLVAFESGLGISLILFFDKVWPVFIAMGILIFFSGILGYAFYRSMGVNCGCFGTMFSKDTSGMGGLVRNGVLIFIAINLLWMNKSKQMSVV